MPQHFVCFGDKILQISVPYKYPFQTMKWLFPVKKVHNATTIALIKIPYKSMFQPYTPLILPWQVT